MQTVEMDVQKRELKSKGALRSLRVSGLVPAVVYGENKEPRTVSVDSKILLKQLKAHGLNILMNLKLEEGQETVLVKEVQKDVLTREPIHVDFLRISLTKKLEVNVPVHLKGEAPGVKTEGGILEHVLREVRVSCLPSQIPASIDLDISSLQLGQHIKAEDLPLAEGVEMVTDADHLIIHIVAPAKEEEVAPAAAVAGAEGTAAEPEVIAKGKKPEEGAEGEGGAAPADKK